MSESADIDLDAVKTHGGYRTGTPDEVDGGEPRDRPTRREHCPDCGRQITVSPTRGIEYGHSKGGWDGRGAGRCPRRPPPELVDPLPRDELPTYRGGGER